MKYWVYKDSRILGPFDKDAFAGLPGVDASTLVCAGESAAARHDDWRPAGDVADLSTVPFDRGAAWPADDLSSTHSLLDRLQIDAAGLIADDEFPGAVETLFQDAELKRSFDGILAKPPVEDAELKRARDRVTELTAHIEVLYKRVSELESGQTDLLHRLAEKEIQLRSRLTPAAPPSADVPARAADPAPAPAPVAAAALAPALVPPPVPVPTAAVPPPSVPPPISFPVPPPAPVPAPAPEPAHDAFASHEAAALPPIFAAAPAPAETSAAEPAPTRPVFERKAFKVVPTVRSFRVVGQESLPEAGFAATPAPAPEPVPEETAAPERGMPSAPEAAAPAPAVPAFDWNAPAPAAEPAAAPISLQPSVRPAEEAPASAPPATFSFGAAAPAQTEAPPVPVFSDPGSFRDDAASSSVSVPPATGIFSGIGSAAPTPAPSTQEVLARLAKPSAEPATAAPRAARSNKRVYLGIGAFVVIMAVAGTVFLRHPKDLKQMAELDDGRARVGAEPVDDASRPPMVKPQPVAQFPSAPPGAPVPPSAPAAPTVPAATGAPGAPAAPEGSVAAAPSAAPAGAGTPAPAEEAQAASQAKLDAAVAAVKDFPLDGERGSVAQWLQFSYSASPDAGKESWSASETADKTYLVEYRFMPSAQGVAEVHYLFEVDMDKGFVIGKNLDAKSMLAGGARVAEAKPKPRPKPRKPAKKAKPVAKRAAAAAAPKEVPLLPLPSEGELRPPAEDDGAFTSDTVNTGL